MAIVGKVRRAATICVATCTVVFGAAQAQDASQGGGIVVALTVAPQIVLSDRDDEGLSAVAGFALSVSDITRSQALTFDATGGLEQSLGGGGSDAFFDRPQLRLGYLYETRGTAIGIDATYSRSDIDDTFADPLTGFLILDDGSRTDLSLGTNIEFGRDAPIGGTFAARRAFRDFEGTTDPSYQDAVIDTASLSLIFRVSPVLDVTAGATYEDIRADEPGTDRRVSGVSVGIVAAVTQTLTVDASIGYDRTERSGGLRPSTTQDGLGFRIGLTQERPNGTLTAALSSRIGTSGRRTRVDIGRSYALRDGRLTFGAGLVASEGGGVDPLYAFSYARELPSGTLSAALQQSYVTDIDGDEAISTTLSLGASRQIGPLSRIRASYTLQDSSVLSGPTEDARRSEFGLTYSRDLTRDWALVAGYTHDRDRDGNAAVNSDNQVFLGIEKTFLWRN